MAGASLTARFEGLDQVQAALREMARLGRQPATLLRPIGAILASNTKDRFDAGTDPTGQRWAPLHPAYLAVKRGPSVLKASLQLQKSITFRVAGDELAIGTNKVYAAIHQFGGTIRPKKPGGRLIFRDAAGQAWGAARQVTIPARPYLGISDGDARDILDTVEIVLLQARQAGARRQA